MNKLSERLQVICNMIRGSGTLADIGCDHAYVPIRMVKSGQFSRAVASDVRPGPLQIAAEHIRAENCSDRISVRLSDGLAGFVPGEADTAVIAGMGGRLTGRILLASPAVTGAMKELILEPQSDLAWVRHTLLETAFAGQYFRITDEDMVEEDGKYYQVIRAVPSEEKEVLSFAYEYSYGPVLLQKRHPVLRQFLIRREAQLQKVLENLEKQESVRIRLRIGELEQERQMIRAAKERYETADLCE